MRIPLTDVVDRIETPEEKAERLKDKYIAQFSVSGKEPSLEEVKRILIEQEGMNEDEASRIAPLLLKEIEENLQESY